MALHSQQISVGFWTRVVSSRPGVTEVLIFGIVLRIVLATSDVVIVLLAFARIQIDGASSRMNIRTVAVVHGRCFAK